MIPRRPLHLWDCGLTPGRDLAAQPFDLLRASHPVVELAHLLARAVAGADEQVGMVVALVSAPVRLVRGPHDRHAPASRDVGGNVGHDLGATCGRHGVRQGDDHLASNPRVAPRLGPIERGRVCRRGPVLGPRVADRNRRSFAGEVKGAAGVQIDRLLRREIRGGSACGAATTSRDRSDGAMVHGDSIAEGSRGASPRARANVVCVSAPLAGGGALKAPRRETACCLANPCLPRQTKAP